MPRTLDPYRYPDRYWRLLDRAQSSPIFIADDAPAGLRAHIQAFLRAVESLGPDDPRAVRAKGTCATQQASPPGVIVQRRDHSIYAQRVAAALGESVEKPVASAENDFLAGLPPLK